MRALLVVPIERSPRRLSAVGQLAAAFARRPKGAAFAPAGRAVGVLFAFFSGDRLGAAFVCRGGRRRTEIECFDHSAMFIAAHAPARPAVAVLLALCTVSGRLGVAVAWFLY